MLSFTVRVSLSLFLAPKLYATMGTMPLFSPKMGINTKLCSLKYTPNTVAAVEVKASVPAELLLTGVELSIVLGNLLDNAIEACREAAGERYIRIFLGLKGSMLYFHMLNSAGPKKRKLGSLFATGKTGAHGFGLHRAQAILKEHGGWCKFNSEDGAFTSEFLVPGTVPGAVQESK